MKHLKQLIWIMFVFLTLSCSPESDEVGNNYVIEGFIIANAPVDNIKVKGTAPIEDVFVQDDPISNATVMLSDGNTDFILSYDTGSNKYGTSDESLKIVSGSEYSLTVNVDGRIATAATSVPFATTNLRLSDNRLVVPALTLNPMLAEQITEMFSENRLFVEWDIEDGRSYFVTVESRVAVLDPILPDRVPPSAKELLSSFSSTSEPAPLPFFQIIGVALETYGPHVVKVFTVNEEYAELFDNFDQDSRDLNEPPSNIENALGIFTGFAVDSLEFDVARN